MVFSFELVIIVILLIWLIVITYFYLNLRNHYNALTQGNSKVTLHEALDRLLHEHELAKKDIDSLLRRCAKIEKESQFYIQKVGLTRYNPFKDTGGDQSFILSLLDQNDTGIVVSGLYSRSGTRWYAKKVLEGKGMEHELTEEEGKAVKLAKSSGE